MWVVFLRGVNVGGNRAFRPSVLAEELAELEMSSLGAAGTFLVRRAAAESTVRKKIAARLPFECELMICPAAEIAALAAKDWFGASPAKLGAKPFVSILGSAPSSSPSLPFDRPAGDEWEVRLIAVEGRYVLSLWHRRGPRVLYPNPVVEKIFAAPATTRGWPTLLAIRDALALKSASPRGGRARGR